MIVVTNSASGFVSKGTSKQKGALNVLFDARFGTLVGVK